MTDFIDTVLEPTLWFLADWSLRWAVLVTVLALWLVVARPRRSASRYLLCFVVLLAGLVLPALPHWGPGFSIPSGKPIPKVAVAEALNPQLRRSGDPVSRTTQQAESRDVSPAGLDRVSPKSSIEPRAAQPAAEPLGLRRIVVLSLAFAWTLGVLIQLTRRLGGWLLLVRMRRTAAPVQGVSSGVFQTCQAQSALRRMVTLAAHLSVRSPVTLGLYHPMILVPPSWTDLPEQVQRGSLLHEMAHLARYDDWLALVFEFVRVVFFFHPFLHWLVGRIEYERELLCDEAALAQGIDPRDYAGLLLGFSRQAGRLRPSLVARSYPLGFGHRRTVKARINRLLEGNMKRWMSPLPAGRAVALSTVALAGAFVLGSFRVRALETEIGPGATKVAAGQSEPPASGVSAKAAPPTSLHEDNRKAKKTYKIEPFHVLKIIVLGVDANHPINGKYLVEPDGKIDIGPVYHKIKVTGLTLEEAEEAVRDFLKRIGFAHPVVSVSLAGWVPKWLGDPAMRAPYHIRPLNLLNMKVLGVDANLPLAGEFLIEPSGKINLGPAYGRVALAGLTLEEAQKAVEEHLKKLGFAHPTVSVTLGGWQNDWNDLMKQGANQTNRPLANSSSSRGSLSYGNKSFAEWRALLVSDLKPEVRIEAIEALSAFGANGYGKEAAEAIIEVMRGYNVAGPDDSQVSGAARLAFRKIGSEGVPALIKELKHGKRNGRRFAIVAIPFTGEEGTKTAGQAVLEAFKDRDSFVRRMAISLLNTRSLDIEPVVAALSQALKDPDPNIRNEAIGRLSLMGKEAEAAVPALLGALKDQNPIVRRLAVSALKAIGPNPEEVLPGLAKALRDDDSAVRLASLEYVIALGPGAKVLVPVLIAGFSAHPEDRFSIATALGSIGPAAKEAIPTLIEFMRSPQGNGLPVENDFQRALRKISN